MLLLLLHLLLEELHGIGLGLLGNLDIGLHGLIVGVAGPLHHHLGRNAAGEREADERTAGSVGANQVALGGSLLCSTKAADISDFFYLRRNLRIKLQIFSKNIALFNS